MALKLVRCPGCGVVDHGSITHAMPFQCPNCGRWLAVRMRTAKWMPWLTLLLAFVIAFGSGLRGVHLLIGVILSWMAALLLAYAIVGSIFPLELKILRPEEAAEKSLTVRQIIHQNREPLELDLTDKKQLPR